MIAQKPLKENKGYVNAEILSYDPNRNIARIKLNEAIAYLVGNSPMGLKAGQTINLRQASSVLVPEDSQIRVSKSRLIDALEKQHTKFLERHRRP